MIKVLTKTQAGRVTKCLEFDQFFVLAESVKFLTTQRRLALEKGINNLIEPFKLFLKGIRLDIWLSEATPNFILCIQARKSTPFTQEDFNNLQRVFGIFYKKQFTSKSLEFRTLLNV